MYNEDSLIGSIIRFFSEKNINPLLFILPFLWVKYYNGLLKVKNIKEFSFSEQVKFWSLVLVSLVTVFLQVDMLI